MRVSNNTIFESINIPDTFCFLTFVGEDNGEPGYGTVYESTSDP